MTELLFVNKALKEIGIQYDVREVREDSEVKWWPSFTNQTVQLIASLKNLPWLSNLTITHSDYIFKSPLPHTQSKVIADACVCFRRKAFDFQVIDEVYLEK